MKGIKVQASRYLKEMKTKLSITLAGQVILTHSVTSCNQVNERRLL